MWVAGVVGPSHRVRVRANHVGRVETVSPEFVDGARTDVRTRLRLRPTEIVAGSLPEASNGLVDVWLRGGVYRRARASGLHPTLVRPADALFGLQPGHLLFVAAARFEKPGSPFHGQLWIPGPDTLAYLPNGRVQPSWGSRRWIDAVVTHGKSLAIGASAPNDATLFLAALHHAAPHVVK